MVDRHRDVKSCKLLTAECDATNAVDRACNVAWSQPFKNTTRKFRGLWPLYLNEKIIIN